MSWKNRILASKVWLATVQLVDQPFAGANEPAPQVRACSQNGSRGDATEYPTSTGGDIVGPTIFGHNGAASAIGVGAVPFCNTEKPEDILVARAGHPLLRSGHGHPRRGTLEPVEIVSKPDVVATDCGDTTFFAASQLGGVWRFYGTSAAAPHAAAVAALMLRGGEPGATPEDRSAPRRCRSGRRSVPARSAPAWSSAGRDRRVRRPRGPPGPEAPRSRRMAPAENAPPHDWGRRSPSSPTPTACRVQAAASGHEVARRRKTFFRQRPGSIRTAAPGRRPFPLRLRPARRHLRLPN